MKIPQRVRLKVPMPTLGEHKDAYDIWFAEANAWLISRLEPARILEL